MTSKEFYDQTVTYENDFDFRTMNLMSNYKGIICDLLNEYARIMCQKQKEICDVTSKTKMREIGIYSKSPFCLNSPFPKELL